MRALSARYPIEWGILIDDDRAGDPLFPSPDQRAALLAQPGLRWAAHVCGGEARAIANDPAAAQVDLTGFQRLQVNHSFAGSSAAQIGNVVRFGRSRGIRTLLQCAGTFPDDARLDWLFDTSFGTGATPSHWPAVGTLAFGGFSGGIGPANARDVVAAIAAPESAQYWIDMESGVRTGGRFDLAKCEAVCRAVYGA
ncbi:hypothetical protein [Sphingomonas sp. MMS24-J13]|uniref:hypothetical protein n=1 Tax=Sphingomonas sp. MMS24-J13 TaxID=3238686 RepID=UPI00384ED039